MKISSRKDGFTLIELLVVIAVIGILASVILASLNSARSKARDAQRISQLREVQKALEMYYADNGTYPAGSNGAGCSAGVWNTPLAPLVSGGYLGAVPADPTNGAVGNVNFCYNYSTASGSAYQCGGTSRSNYTYAIMFSLENANSNFLVASNVPSPTFGYCVTGERD